MDMNTFSSLYLDVIDRGNEGLKQIMRSALDLYFDRSRPVRINVGQDIVYLFPDGINGKQCKVTEKNNLGSWNKPDYLDYISRTDVVKFSQTVPTRLDVVLTFGNYDRIVGVRVGAENMNGGIGDRLDFTVEYI